MVRGSTSPNPAVIPESLMQSKPYGVHFPAPHVESVEPEYRRQLTSVMHSKQRFKA